LEGDLSDQTSLDNAIQTAAPDEIYNLAAQSFVATSFKQPIATTTITGMGAVRVFESARRICPKAKIYQASSSEMFGNVIENPQNEKTKFSPRSLMPALKCMPSDRVGLQRSLWYEYLLRNLF